jgi:hypothetical protein
MNGTTALKKETPNVNTGNAFPWAGQPDETACNYAFGLLVRNLPARIMLEGKLHAPTLMAAAGAIAGVSAQVSLLADAEKIEKARADKRIQEIKFKADNRLFLHGDALNEMLYSVRDPVIAKSRVWNMMVSAALQRGLAREKLPNVPNMFKHVSESFGTAREGRPSVDERAQPVASVRDLLALTGPVAFAALAGEIDPTTTAMAGRANRKSWVAISAQAAANMLFTASKIMPPETCLTIARESAIYASKMRANAPVEAPPEHDQAEAPQA